MGFWTFLKILKSHFFKKVIFLFFWLFQFFDFLGYLNYSKSRQSWRVSVCHFTNWHIRGWLFIHSSLRQQRDRTFTHLYPSIHRTYTHLFTYFKCFPSVSPHPPRTLAITNAEGYYPIHTLSTLWFTSNTRQEHQKLCSNTRSLRCIPTYLSPLFHTCNVVLSSVA